MSGIYDTLRWRATAAAVRRRDGNRCTAALLLGGQCAHGTFHVHHLVPLEEGGHAYEHANLITLCARHHPMLEAVRRALVIRARQPDREVRCRHFHRTADARRQCEARMTRQLAS